MLFNSLLFLLFFPIVCILYFILKSNKTRIPFLLIASYYFYMNWNPSYAILLFTSTLLTFLCGVYVEKYKEDKQTKKIFLISSLVINFSILFIFKYFNFINETIFSLLIYTGLKWEIPNLDILLPVGISFYTFQAVGYSIDVYRGTIKAEKNFLTYALFVSFFPQLVAGPIERAKNLLPQFHEEHCFNNQNAVEGLKLMLWGFFMKICVADTLSEYVNAVYNNVEHHNGTSLILATIFFAFQIYCDFGGYSSIAIGTAKVMGFRLMENFHYPYLSLNIKEFWRRWHISLSSWFTDYLYIPLGGNKVKKTRHLLNVVITFLVSGIWHGANWTFVIWGLLHGFYQVLWILIRRFVYAPQYNSWFSKCWGIISCFTIVTFAWIFFRANNLKDAFLILEKIYSEQGPLFVDEMTFLSGSLGLFVLFFKDFKDNFNIQIHFMHSKFLIVRYLSIIVLITYIVLFGAFSSGQFIYFQF